MHVFLRRVSPILTLPLIGVLALTAALYGSAGASGGSTRKAPISVRISGNKDRPERGTAFQAVSGSGFQPEEQGQDGPGTHRLEGDATPVLTPLRQAPGDYLSGPLSERIVSETQGWGVLGFDSCAHMPGQTPLKLRIGDKEYAHGLGHHANGEIVVDLGRQFQTFMAEVGVEWQGQNTGSVRFCIFVDGKQAFDSGVMHESDPAKPVSVSVKGARILRLVATDGGDGITCDAAVWADARLVRDPNPPKSSKMEAIDMAPYAMVASWDAKSTGGTSATRVTEFPAKDIAPYKELLAGADGNYPVPIVDGVGCIGLQWVENRILRRLSLRFEPGPGQPGPTQVNMQFWEGDSVWQGNWVDAGIKAETSGNSLTWRIGLNTLPRGTPKVRWLVHGVPGRA